MKKIFILLFILVSVGFVYANGQQDVAVKKELTVAVTENPISLDPTATLSNVSMRVMKNIHETFIEIAEDGTIIPKLAESWNQIDDRTVEFTLRKGVVSQAGFPLDADDVLISFGAGRTQNPEDPGYEFFRQCMVDPFDSIEKVNEYTIRFTKSKPDPILLKRFSFDETSIICGDSYKAKTSWEDWSVHPVGFGPYKVSEYKPDEYLSIEKFEDYYGDKAPVDKITYVVVPDMSPRIMGLLSGDYDIITEIMPDQFNTIENKKGFKVAGGPVNNIRMIIFDESNPILKDARVRRALSYAIDRELINNTIFKSLSEIPRGIQMESFGDMYISEYKPVGFNPELAKKLLKEAGYNGEEISYRYMMDYYTGEVATAEILQQMWADVGLNVKIELKENWSQIYLDEAAEGRGMINWSCTAKLPDPLTQMAQEYGPGGWFQNHNMWFTDEYNGLYEDLSGTDNAKRRKAFAKMLDLVENQDPPGTYLYFLPKFFGINEKVNWSPVKSHFMDFRAGKLEISE